MFFCEKVFAENFNMAGIKHGSIDVDNDDIIFVSFQTVPNLF